LELRDRVAVVTGGASGIGAASARAFAAEGALVAVLDRNGEGAKAVAAEVKGLAVECDVGDQRSIDAALERVEADLGPIEVCFSNAGIGGGGDMLRGDVEAWDRQWAVNVMGQVYAVRKVLPAMLERGEGYLIHTASMAGILIAQGDAAYTATKHAVVGLAEWLSVTYHNRGVHTSLLAPLGVRTPMLGPNVDLAAQQLGDVAEPEDVAQLVVDAVREERFLILTAPIAETFMDRKASDLERWLRGMRRHAERGPGSPADPR
jgi:NAD(P)-dependent dehydrogenase (short-subunit alcohol dehydrogenase family)